MAVNWGEIFKQPENQAALIKSGTGLVGSMMEGNALHQKAQEERAQSTQDTARNRQFGVLDSRRTQENADFGASQNQLDDADQTVLGAMGKSPLQFQNERMKTNAIADALQAGGPSNVSAHMAPWARGMDMSKFRPSAGAEQPYWDAVAQASKGRFNGAGMSDVYGGPAGQAADIKSLGIASQAGQDFQDQWTDHRNANAEIFKNAGGMADADYKTAMEAQAQDDDGGGFWGGLGGILKKAAPLAALIPGVGLPLAMGLGAAGAFGGSMMQGKGVGDSFKSAAGGAAGAALGEATQKYAPKIFGSAAKAPKLDTNALLSSLQPQRAKAGVPYGVGTSTAMPQYGQLPNVSNTGGFRLGMG